MGELKLRSCDLVIGLTHVGSTWVKELVRQIDGMDIIIDGNDLMPLCETMQDTIVLQEGSGGEYLSVLDFTVQNGRMENPSWKRILMDSQVGFDPQIQNLMESYVASYEEGLKQRIGESRVDLDAREERLRLGETNLGDLVVDSWTQRLPEADMALVNSGSIRGGRIYEAGPLTYLTVNEILPFQGRIQMVEMTGAAIRQVLEISASAIRVEGDGCEEGNRAPTGGFMQVSGIRIALDLREPCFCGRYSGRELAEIIDYGDRVFDVEVYRQNAWVKLDPSTIYRVLLNAYTADGGDGQYPFLAEEMRKIDTGMVTTDVLADYIIRHTPIAPEIDGRIDLLGGR